MFEKLRKATISVVMSVCPSVRPHETTCGSHWTYPYEIFYLSIFRKSAEKIQVQLKWTKITIILRGLEL